MSDEVEQKKTPDRFRSHPGQDSKRKLPRRFYTQVGVKSEAGVFLIELDGRQVKTPGREPLAVASKELASAIAQEWEAQEKEIDPEKMLLTKLANTTLDRVGPRREGIIDEITAFASSDLLCYRAEEPEGLVKRQALAWDPMLQWLETLTGAKLKVTSGIVFTTQSEANIDLLRSNVAARGDFDLAGLHQAVSLTGSLALGLALLEAQIDADAAHTMATIDEAWQMDQWGSDQEAEERLNHRRRELLAIGHYLELLRGAASPV